LASVRSKPDSSGQPYTRSETAFNADLREVLRAQGLGVVHVREADNPGVFDLHVSRSYRRRKDGPLHPHRYLWVELKIEHEELRPSQKTWARERVALGELLLVARLRTGEAIQIMDYLSQREVLYLPTFRLQNWTTLLDRLLDEHYVDL